MLSLFLFQGALIHMFGSKEEADTEGQGTETLTAGGDGPLPTVAVSQGPPLPEKSAASKPRRQITG